MSNVKYSEEHEWIRVEGDVGTVGITDYAQEQMGDVVFVDLPDVGQELTKGGDAAVVESVKAASDVFAPLTGAVTEANEALADDPSLVNSGAEGDGWLFKMTIADASVLEGLRDEAAYKAFLEAQE